MVERTLEKELDALRGEFDKIKEDIKKDIAAIAKSASRSGTKIYDELKDGAVSRGREGLATVEQQVMERPVTSLLVAFGVGLVLGKLFDRG